MPESCQEPYDGDVSKRLHLPFAVSAQGNIDVLPEPAAKAHMPSAPKLCDALRRKRIIEILQKVKPKNLSKPDGHIGIAAEIKIDLKDKGCRTKPSGDKGQITHGDRLHLFP